MNGFDTSVGVIEMKRSLVGFSVTVMVLSLSSRSFARDHRNRDFSPEQQKSTTTSAPVHLQVQQDKCEMDRAKLVKTSRAMREFGPIAGDRF
jgi:hypothetical protein